MMLMLLAMMIVMMIVMMMVLMMTVCNIDELKDRKLRRGCVQTNWSSCYNTPDQIFVEGQYLT